MLAETVLPPCCLVAAQCPSSRSVRATSVALLILAESASPLTRTHTAPRPLPRPRLSLPSAGVQVRIRLRPLAKSSPASERGSAETDRVLRTRGCGCASAAVRNRCDCSESCSFCVVPSVAALLLLLLLLFLLLLHLAHHSRRLIVRCAFHFNRQPSRILHQFVAPTVRHYKRQQRPRRAHAIHKHLFHHTHLHKIVHKRQHSTRAMTNRQADRQAYGYNRRSVHHADVDHQCEGLEIRLCPQRTQRRPHCTQHVATVSTQRSTHTLLATNRAHNGVERR